VSTVAWIAVIWFVGPLIGVLISLVLFRENK
jgi:hypothetical protein